MSTTPQPLNDLVGKIRAAYPGAYDDMDDAALTKAVLAKYPQYSDLAAPKLTVGAPSNVRMQEIHTPMTSPRAGGLGPGIEQMSPEEQQGLMQAGGATLASLPTLLTGGMGLPAQAAISGLSGAAQSKIEGGSNKEALISGGIGAALPVAGRGISKAASYFSHSGIQSSIKQSLGAILEAVTGEEGVAAPATKSVRTAVEETADNVLSKSKSQYSQIDQATGGRFQRFSDALKRIDRKIADVADIDPEQEGRLIERRNEIQDALDKTFEDAKTAGIDQSSIDDANANFKKAMALQDLDRAVKASTSGVEPATAESVDPAKLSKRLEKLYDSGRLQQAVGEERAQQMLKESHAAEIRVKRVGTAKKAAAVAGKAAAVGAGGGAAYEVGKSLTH